MNFTINNKSKSINTDLQRKISSKIAYIILAHSDTEHFGRLIRKLADPRVTFIVHIDAKVALAPFKQAAIGVPNVVFVEDRIRVMWAAFSQVGSTLRAFQTALAHTDLRYSHFVILSGADYPIATNDAILTKFTTNTDRQFIRRFDVLGSRDIRQQQRILGWHFRELADRYTWQRKPIFALESILNIVPKKIPKDILFASGSNWVALSRKCVEYCIKFSEENPDFVRIFKKSFASDEIYFHTLIQNSPFVDQCDPLEPYYDVTLLGGPWKYGNIHFLNAKETIRSSIEAESILKNYPDMLFARKFSSNLSQEALTYIDRHLQK